MKKLLTAVGLVAFLLAYSAPVEAVKLYVTADQGFPFTAGGGSPSPEIDGIGDTGILDLTATNPSLVLFNLWIDTQGETLTVFSIRVNAVNGALFTSTTAGITTGFADGATLGGGLVSSQVAGSYFTSIISSAFPTACSKSSSPLPGLASGKKTGRRLQDRRKS